MSKSMERQKVKKEEMKVAISALFKYLSLQKKYFSLALFGVFITAGADALRPLIIGRFFDELSLDNLVISEVIIVLISLIAIMGIASGFGNWISARASARVRAETIQEYRIKALDALLSYPVSFYKKQKTGEVHEIITRTEEATGNFIGFNLPVIAVDTLTLSFALIFVFTISPLLGAILFFGIGVFYLMVRVITPKIQKLAKQLNESLNEIKNDYFEIVTNIFEIKRNTTELSEKKKIREGYKKEFVPRSMKEEYLWSNNDLARRVVIFSTQFFLFLFGTMLVVSGDITPGQVVSLILYASMAFRPIFRISNWWLHLNRTLIKIYEGEKLLSHPVERDGEVDQEISRGEIEFRDTSFSYDEGEALRNISFTVPAGSTVALVGESGAGKTTAIELMGGYYIPQVGQVLIDGVSTNDYERYVLRSSLGYVSQEVTLFNDTIARNIAYGAREEVGEKDIRDAAKAAGIDTYIEGLEDGYQTNVGERGLRLSVGQKQRIAIARAFLRDPKILILDEPTSALDAKTERHVTDSLKDLMKDRTTVIIAHRLSTTRDADLILVFKKGEIVERGSHKELLSMNGEYAHMYNEHVGLN